MAWQAEAVEASSPLRRGLSGMDAPTRANGLTRSSKSGRKPGVLQAVRGAVELVAEAATPSSLEQRPPRCPEQPCHITPAYPQLLHKKLHFGCHFFGVLLPYGLQDDISEKAVALPGIEDLFL